MVGPRVHDFEISPPPASQRVEEAGPSIDRLYFRIP